MAVVSLDCAILRFEEEAAGYTKEAKKYEKGSNKRYAMLSTAEGKRQVANWLRELRSFRLNSGFYSENSIMM